MENRVVCFYCGTIYEAEEEKCPLCGGKTLAKEEEIHQPVQRRRITEQERRQRRRASKGGKFAASNKNKKDSESGPSKKMLIAALIFLALSVVVVTWFIGDMIGWWGGLEDTIQRDDQTASIDVNKESTYMELSDESIHLEQIGETHSLKLKVNSAWSEKIEITWPDAAIATVHSEGNSIVEGEYKTDVWVITAVSEGTTKMEFKCGEFYASCEIAVGEYKPEEPDESSEAEGSSETEELPETNEPVVPDEDYEPELNFSEDISLYYKGESVPLQIVNLPEGATVIWRSADETVAKVDENGVVTAVSSGSTIVTAEVFGKTVEVLIRCPFDESGDIGAHLKYEDVTIKVGEVFYLYLLDSNNDRITDVTYEMSKDGVCTIENGKVTGVKGGTNVTITVIYNTQRYECIVRVRG